MELELILFALALIAGLVDAIAGGGGLITVPALLFFLPGGHIVWAYGLAMAAGQLIGGRVGSHLVLQHGTWLIRPVLVIAFLAVSAKILVEQLDQ